jgi:hypothetical protein
MAIVIWMSTPPSTTDPFAIYTLGIVLNNTSFQVYSNNTTMWRYIFCATYSCIHHLFPRALNHDKWINNIDFHLHTFHSLSCSRKPTMKSMERSE